MRRIIGVISLLLLVGSQAQSEQLSQERQREIVQGYLYVTGQRDRLNALSLDEGLPEGPLKCGTPAVMDFVMNRDKLDPVLLKSAGLEALDRSVYDHLTESVLSPSGVFLIHYTNSGTDRVYTGFAGYADSVAKIFDEVYAFMVDTLGYPPPPSDGFYDPAGPEFDVYLIDLGGSVYGLTYLDEEEIDGPSSTRATAFQVLDNDYREDVFTSKYDDPLDPVRVTCAHEFFHVVQFGMDFTELELEPDSAYHSYWMEMSATWMEDMKYDYINDYINYLPFFYRDAYRSIEQYLGWWDYHPYGAMVFPLFLSERFDRDVIREIWLQCALMGQGSHFLMAAEHVIDSATLGQESFATAFQEFALWNFFTGPRSAQAPAGMGYSERFLWGDDIWFGEYPPDPDIVVLNGYSDTVSVPGYDNTFNPDHNAAFYLKLNELRLLKPDTSYWICNSGSFPTCLDSTEVTDPLADYDIMHIDSTLSVALALTSTFRDPWGFSTIYQFEDNLDSTEVVQSTLPRGAIDTITFNSSELTQLRSVTFVLTPASDDTALYTPNYDYDIGYSLWADLYTLDSAMMNLPAAMLSPYPNPVVVSELANDAMTFKFQVPTDSSGFPIYGQYYSGTIPSLVVDLFTVTGDHVRTLDETTFADDRLGEYRVEWDLRNAAGKNVASGVYIAYGRLYASSTRQTVIAEEKAKVVVIR